MNVWSVFGSEPKGPLVAQGDEVGKVISERFAIDWTFPADPNHPAWTTRIERADVRCEDGPEHSTEKFVQVTEVSHTAHTVLFHGNLFSFKRSIWLRANCLVQKGDSDKNRWFPLAPNNAFACDLQLVVEPGPEPQNPPWSEPEGVEIRERTGGLKVQTRTNQPITLRIGEAEWGDPLDGDYVRDVSIVNSDKDAVCNHPHATKDLLPLITYATLPDGTGVVLYPSNCRPYSRYTIVVNRGSNLVVRLRTTE